MGESFYDKMASIIVSTEGTLKYDCEFQNDLFAYTLSWKALTPLEEWRVKKECLKLLQEELSAGGNMRSLYISKSSVVFYAQCNLVWKNKNEV